MKANKILSVLLAALLTLTLAACGEDTPSGSRGESAADESLPTATPAPEEYPAEVGGIHLYEQPQRVVSLSPVLSEVICDLGYTDALVGVSSSCDFTDALDALPDCGTALLPALDTVEQLQPDLLVSIAPLIEADLVTLQQMDVEVIILENPRSLEALEAFYHDVGIMMGGKHTGAAAADLLCEEILGGLQEVSDAVESYLAAGGEAVKGAYVAALPYNTATGDTLEDELLTCIGVENVAGEYTGYIYPKAEILNFNPDLLFYNLSNITEEEILASDLIKNTRAEKNDRAYEVDGRALERRGSSMLREVVLMAFEAYPELSF